MKWAILLVFLVACAPAVQETSTAPTTQKTLPRPEPAPIIEPEIVKVQPEIVKQPEPVAPQVELTCTQNCENMCAESAQTSCTQAQRAQCRQNCGNIIDPSACTQACSYLSQPQVCKQQHQKFCSAKCVEICY